jgi:hypothetical protein
VLTVVAAGVLLGPAGAQTPADTTVVAGPHYAAGAIHRFFLGSRYRGLWTRSLDVPILDLATYGGGLVPTTAGGGFQTKSLRFDGADGFKYGFRSVDKDPSVLPPELAGTIVEDVIKDQTSSQHPAAPAVVAPLLEAAGLLHTDPTLVVLPDAPGLEDHRERFAGTLGFLERRAVVEPGVPPFAGAVEIIDSDELLARVARGPADRLDARTYLKARLVDLLIGDWDRHRGQWTWARFGDAPVTRWVPIPEDRDQAFVRFDGLLLALARIYAPQLTSFGQEYPSIEGATWNGRDLDRRFLVELAWPVWDSVVADLQARLTDSVIDAAVAALPPEYEVLDGARLGAALTARRTALPAAADAFYQQLARQPEIHLTDAAERVRVVRNGSGTVDVAIASEGAPYWSRRFLAGETRELRILLAGGADRLTVTGPGRALTLHVVASGNDEIVNESAGGLRLYTTGGDRWRGRVSVDRRPFELPSLAEGELPPRDWGSRGRWVVWSYFGPDIGVFLGGGRYTKTFGFRYLPWRSRMTARVGYATDARTVRADFAGMFYRRNSRVYYEADVLASGIEVLWFYGFGNETEELEPEEYYRVNQQQFSFAPAIVVPLRDSTVLRVGPTLEYSNTEDEVGRVINALRPYGSGAFGQVGLEADVVWDSRDVPAAATRGVRIAIGGSLFPPVWDVEEFFGELHFEGSAYVTAHGVPLRPTLAVRAGGKEVFGRFPFQEAAFLGDERTVRLGRQNRLAGDRSQYGNAELRLRLGSLMLVLPADVGVFGLADIGRVYADGEASDRWHWALGGGVWLAYLHPGNTLRVALAKSEERLGVYVGAGFAF